MRPAALSRRHATLHGVARAFNQVDVFTTEPYARQSGRGRARRRRARHRRRCSASRTGRTCPRRRSCCRPTPGRRLPRADLHAGRRAAVRRAPDARHLPRVAEAGGAPRATDAIVQECAAGLIRVRRTPDGLAFAAPPLLRSGPVEDAVVERDRVGPAASTAPTIVDAAWADNGPGWVAVLLRDADAVLALRPGFVDLDLGVVGPYPAGSPSAFEVRAFFPKDGSTVEDPVTGSLNASLAQWLLGTGRRDGAVRRGQGTALGRAGRVHITRDDDGADLGRRRHGRPASPAKSSYSCACNYFPRSGHEARGPAPRHDDHGRRAAQRRLLRRRRSACGSSRRRSTSTRPTPTTCTSATSRARPGSILTWFEFAGARRGRAGAGMIHTIAARRRLRGGARLLGRAAAPRATRAARRRSLRFADYDGLRSSSSSSDDGNPPLRAEHPEVPAEHAILGIEGARAYGADRRRHALLTETLGFTDLGDGEYRLDGDERHFHWAYDPPPRRARPAGRRHRPPHRVGVARRGPPGLAAARRARRAARHRRARPRLLPLDLLPRAARRSCSRSPRSRPASPSTRTPSTSARSCACPPSTSTCARSSSACSRRRQPARRAPRGAGMSALTYRERPADGRPRRPARPPPRPRRRRARPARPRRRARPGAPPARRHAARAADARRLAGPPLVRRAARRLPRPRHVPRRVRASSPRFHDELWERTGIAPEQTRCSAASRWARS